MNSSSGTSADFSAKSDMVHQFRAVRTEAHQRPFPRRRADGQQPPAGRQRGKISGPDARRQQARHPFFRGYDHGQARNAVRQSVAAVPEGGKHGPPSPIHHPHSAAAVLPCRLPAAQKADSQHTEPAEKQHRGGGRALMQQGIRQAAQQQGRSKHPGKKRESCPAKGQHRDAQHGGQQERKPAKQPASRPGQQCVRRPQRRARRGPQAVKPRPPQPRRQQQRKKIHPEIHEQIRFTIHPHFACPPMRSIEQCAFRGRRKRMQTRSKKTGRFSILLSVQSWFHGAGVLTSSKF